MKKGKQLVPLTWRRGGKLWNLNGNPGWGTSPSDLLDALRGDVCLTLAIAVLLHQVYYSRKDKVEMVQTITSGTSKAILILADGLPVVLEQQQEKTLKESDGTKINVLKEHISYERGVDDKQEKSVYHELVIPRGESFL